MQLQFKRNLGLIDRVIRVLIGLILLSLVLTHIATGWMVPYALYIGGIIIFEAGIGY